MRKVQTAFLGSERIQLLIDTDRHGLWYNGDRTLILGYRTPLPTDWVNGKFVGDHHCPDEDDGTPHVHGEPVA